MATVMQQHPVIEALFWQTGTKGSWRDVGTGEERRAGGRDRNRLDRQEKENVLIDKGWGQERVCQIREEKKMEKVSKEATHTKKKKRQKDEKVQNISTALSRDFFILSLWQSFSHSWEISLGFIYGTRGGKKLRKDFFCSRPAATKLISDIYNKKCCWFHVVLILICTWQKSSCFFY